MGYKFTSRFNSSDRQKLLEKSQQCLWLTEGKPGMEYLTQTRKLSESVIKLFGLGYIPHDVKHPLAGRIIFPLYDSSTNLIALTSRHIASNKTLLPVHWHEQYEKSFYIYGCNLAKKFMRELGWGLVVEGQGDVMQLHNHGIRNAVGLCGTALSTVQLATILRYCDEIIVLLDSDENKAGQRAAEKITRATYGHKIESVMLPIGMDPDDIIKKHGTEKLVKVINDKLNELRTRCNGH
jgi:DNA primase